MNLLIIGAGQYGLVAKEIAEELGYHVDFLDDNSKLAIGKPSEVDRFRGDVVAIGNLNVKKKFIPEFKDRLVSLISPKAYIAPSARIGVGCIVEPLAVVNTGARLGDGCFVSAGAVVNHDCVVGDYSHVDCNATVMKSAVVPEGTIIASNTSFCG